MDKKRQLLEMFDGCYTMVAVAKKLNTTKQNIQSKIYRYGLKEAWEKHSSKLKKNKHLSNIPVVYALFFIQNPSKKYIGATKNFRNRFRDHLCNLKTQKHYSVELLNDFNRFGEKNLRYKIIKQVKDPSLLLSEELKEVKNQREAYNLVNFTPDFYKRREYLNYQDRRIAIFNCTKCGHEWFSRVNQPKCCPQCKSKKWRTPNGTVDQQRQKRVPGVPAKIHVHDRKRVSSDKRRGRADVRNADT